MTYSTHSTVRQVAGRLALDFLNTANWTAEDQVLQEKIKSMADLNVWMSALHLSDAIPPNSVDDIYSFRSNLRSLFIDDLQMRDNDFGKYLEGFETQNLKTVDLVRRQPILGLVAISALSMLSDVRELTRVKKCPGTECGWLFLDETKNARRKWCIMETCGNRAKAARNYARKTQHK